jgi:ribosomal protein S17E
MSKIAVVITFFGKFPAYMDYFIETCTYNKNLDFIFFTDDTSYASSSFLNVKFISLTLGEFNTLASKKIGTQVTLKKGYKLCDLRPMYGVVYEDYLSGYDFWGYCDTDIVFGDTSKILTDDLLANYDIISSHSQYMSGPFSLYRNIPEANNLFKQSKDYQRVIQDDANLSFDEASSVIAHLWEGHNIFDFETTVESMTHLVKNESKHHLRARFTGYITERVQGKLLWQDGVLRNEAGHELYIFHYIVYKPKISFNTPPFVQNQRFFFTENGFFLDGFKSYGIDWPKSIAKNFTDKAMRKIKTFLAT